MDWDEGVIYLSTTSKDGAETVTEHRCWHRGRFLASASESATKEGSKVAAISAEQYRSARPR